MYLQCRIKIKCDSTGRGRNSWNRRIDCLYEAVRNSTDQRQRQLKLLNLQFSGPTSAGGATWWSSNPLTRPATTMYINMVSPQSTCLASSAREVTRCHSFIRAAFAERNGAAKCTLTHFVRIGRSRRLSCSLSHSAEVDGRYLRSICRLT